MQTFNEILRKVETTNAELIIQKAYRANRIAKSADTALARRRAYDVKLNLLVGLQTRFPNQTRVRVDPATPGFVLVSYSSAKTTTRCTLHAPASSFTCARN